MKQESISRFDLVCGRSSVPVIAKMIFFSGPAFLAFTLAANFEDKNLLKICQNICSGFAVGTFVAGIVSDMFGRKR